MAKNLRALMIVEIAGRPAEHIKKALENHIKSMESKKDVEIVSQMLSDPNLIDKEKNIFSCFAEVEVEVETLARLTELVFDFMPSSIELLEPDKVSLSSQEATMFLNDLAGRLHKYDEIAKIAQLRNKQMFDAFQKLQGQIAEKSKSEEKPLVEKKASKKVSKKKK